MTLSRVPALSFVAALSATFSVVALACAPVPDAEVPIDEDDRPCKTDDDCELRKTETGPRSMLCGNRGVAWGSSPAKDAAACGPMPNMTPNLAEPVLMCFRGACVPVDKDR